MKKFLLPFIVVCLLGDTSTGAITATIRSQLANISTRGSVETGDGVMIGGFVINGTVPKTVMIRAIGPSLTQFGISNALSDPVLELHDSTTALIASNDNWQTTQIGGIITADQVSDIQNSQLAPTQPTESAIIATLQPGRYTAIVRGQNATTGVALVEVYDLSPTDTATLGNISTRGLVEIGDGVMIGGFVINGTVPKTVMIRAIGPSLTQFGINNALADPTLQLHDGTGAIIASNDNWQTTQIGGIITADQVSDIHNSQLAPTQPTESAIIATLQPGRYTAIVRGNNNATGVALVEVYYLNTAPIPLTPLILATSGVDSTSPVSVTFSNSAGFSFSDQPIRVEADGTVVVAVPLYVDPGTNGITSGTVSMVVTQGSNSSPPVSLDIQNLPTLATYGTQLGQISHALLIMDATLLGRQLNQLQAAQLLFNDVDTSAAQATTNTLLNNVIKARGNVDRVMLDNSTVITGTLTDGSPIQFDKNSLDMMDRVIAVYLTQLRNTTSNSSGAASGAGGTSAAQSVAGQSGAASSAGSLATFLGTMENLNDATEIVELVQNRQNQDNTPTDNYLAVAKGVNSFCGLAADALKDIGAGLRSQALGLVLGVVDVYHHGSQMFSDLGALINASASGAPLADYQKAADNFQTHSIQVAFDLGGLALNVASLYLKDVNPVGAGIIAVAQYGLTALNIFSETDAGKQAFQTALGVSGEIPKFSVPDDGFGTVDGLIQVSTDLGEAAPQQSPTLCCLTGISFSGSELETMADPGGNYELFVPLQTPSNYQALQLQDVDYLTTTILGMENVDLSGLDTSQPVQLADLSVTCNDPDANDPGEDDEPDCE